ncbi:MAG: sporulation integral membrane protein YtvI [Lachnospiraceae bacterium]|jgi:sporulation integral membrane protein YtvI|nr:sporulation integral membrane protein YtvI [Lachnospiraceae bacterium]
MKQETKAYCKALTNIILALIGLVLLIIVLPRVLSFFMPFVVAWIIALLASPMVKFLEEKLKIRRKAGTACVIIAVIALIVLIGYGVAAFLIDQIQGLMHDLPDIWEGLQLQIDEISRSFSRLFASLPKDVQESWAYFFENVENSLGEWVAGLGTPSMSWLGSMAKQLPNLFVAVIMCLVAAFAFTAERANMRNFMQDYMPETMKKYWDMIRVSLSSAVGGYLKAQLKIECWIYLIVAAGLLILRISYAPVLAIFIAVLDFLPVFGTGTILWPWIVFEVFGRNYKLAIGLALIWGVSQIVRQVIQPKIMGDSMGMHTLPTVFLLYIGYKVSGIFGMIIAVPIGIIFVNMYQAGVFDTIVNSFRILGAGLKRFRHLTKEDIRLAYHEAEEENSDEEVL